MQVTRAALIRSLCRESFFDFFCTFWHTVNTDELKTSWYIEKLCNEVQAAYERVFADKDKEYDLVVNIPPGLSKSTIFSIMAPAWAWTRKPSFRFLGASHGHNLAATLSMKNRDVVRSELYRTCFPEVVLRDDLDTRGHFMTTAGGVRYAVGSGGKIAGIIHADVIGIDDPLDPEQVLSDAETDAVNHWMTHALLSRKRDARVTFVQLIMQRLGQNDPTGEFLRVVPSVRHIVLPGDLEYPVSPPGWARYYRDGLLDPVRRPRNFLDGEKKRGEFFYAGQVGQSPVPAGGGKFKVDLIKPARPAERFVKLARFWDKAVSTSRRAAYTVGVKMGLDQDGRYCVLDVVRGRWDSFTREQVIERTAAADGRDVVVGLEQEPGSAGRDSAEATVRRLLGHRVQIFPATGSKEVRADEFSVAVNAGLVYLPDHLWRDGGWAGWAKDYVDELRHWPFSRYKDQGDASGGAFRMVVKPKIIVGPLRKLTKP